MHYMKNGIVGLFMLLGMIFFGACEDQGQIQNDTFVIEIDSVEVPDNVTANTPFVLRFYGLVGTDGCYQFSHFRQQVYDNVVLVTSIGTHKSGAVDCPAVMVYLEGEPLTLTLNEPGKYLLTVQQPDNQIMETEIGVE